MADAGGFGLDKFKSVASRAGKKIADSTGAAWQQTAEFAGGVTQAVKTGSEQAFVKFTAIKDDLLERLPGRHRNGVDISALDDEAKLLYSEVLVQLAAVDHVLDPREVANLYLFASTIALSAEARGELRRSITEAGRNPLDADESRQRARVLAESLRDRLEAGEGEAVFTALIRDLIRLSRADLDHSEEEREWILHVAKVVFPFAAAEVVAATEELVLTEEEFAAGQISASQLEKATKDVVAKAAAFGAPIAAVSMLGSVSGLGAAGITSGLATLGFGGVLGLSSMVTGIGVAVLLGVGVFVGARYVLGVNERERSRRREHLIQQVIKSHQQAMAELSEDIAGLAGKIDEALSSTSRNEQRLAALRAELDAFQQALATLRSSHDVFEQAEPLSAD